MAPELHVVRQGLNKVLWRFAMDTNPGDLLQQMRTFEVPPHDFDPLTAPDHLLLPRSEPAINYAICIICR
jgi:hypothetical protein